MGPADGLQLRVFSGGGGGTVTLTTATLTDMTGLIYGNGTDLDPIANVAAGQALVSGTPPAWSASPSLTGLTLSGNLALGATSVINWNSGAMTITGAADSLTIAGGVLVLPTSNSAITVVGEGVYPLQVASSYIGFGITTTGDIHIRPSTLTSTWRIDNTGLLPYTDASVPIGSSTFRPTRLWLSAPAITPGSGTGVTVNSSGESGEVIYKVTVLSTNCIANATTCDLTIGILPAKTMLRQVFADLTVTYACTATCTTATLSGTLGTSAGGAEVLASMDLDAAAVLFGDADAELGTSMNAAAVTANGAMNSGVLFSWTGTTTLTYRITSAVGNLGNGSTTNLSQGTIVFYLVTMKLP